MIGQIHLTIDKFASQVLIGGVIVVSTVSSIRKMFRRMSFRKTCEGALRVPHNFSFNFDAGALHNQRHLIQYPSSWTAQKTFFPSKAVDKEFDALSNRVVDSIDDRLATVGKGPYFRTKGVDSNVAVTSIKFTLLRDDGYGEKANFFKVSGYGCLDNERQTGNSQFLLRINAGDPANQWDVSKRWSRTRFLCLRINQYYDSFDSTRFFPMYLLIRCEFYWKTLRWKQGVCFMALENVICDGEDNLETIPNQRVVIGFSDDHMF